MSTLRTAADLRSALTGRTKDAAKAALLSLWGPGQLSQTLWTLTLHVGFKRLALASLDPQHLAKALVGWARCDRITCPEDVLAPEAVDKLKAYQRKVSAKMAKLGKTRQGRAKRQGYLQRILKAAVSRVAATESAEKRKQLRRSLLQVVNGLYFGVLFAKCALCGFELGFVRHKCSEKKGTRRNFPHNASLDAVRPRHSGGQYVAGNVQLVCKACNGVKAGFPHDVALVLLDELRRAEWVVVDGFLRPAKPAAPKAVRSAEDDAMIESWATVRANIATPRFGARGQAVKADIVNLMHAVYVGDGKYQDPTGLVLSINFAQLDRIDPRQGYVTGNLRLVASFVNWIRGAGADDAAPADFLQDLKECTKLDEARTLRAKGVKVPWASPSGSGSSAALKLLEPDLLVGGEEEDDDEEDEDDDVACTARVDGWD